MLPTHLRFATSCCCCLLVLLLACLQHHGVDGQASRTAIYLTIAVEDVDIFNVLNTLLAVPTSTIFYEALTAGIRFNFTHIPIRGSLENVSSAETVHNLLLSMKASAVVSDFYTSMAMATYSIGIPCFIIRKYVDDVPRSKNGNLFEIEIDNNQLSQALYDVSSHYKKTMLVGVSDGTSFSSMFLTNLAGRTFSVHTVNNSGTDDSIFSAFASYDSDSVSSSVGWILLFDENNLPLMERTLSQASRAGLLVQSQYFFVPSLFDKERYLTSFYRGKAEFFSFRLADRDKYTRDQLLYPFIVDAINHYIKAHSRWRGLSINTTISDAILHEPTIASPQTGPYTYDPVYRVRSNVQLEVTRSNSSHPASDFFGFAGTWKSSGLPPFTPDYSQADIVSRSLIKFAAYESEPYFYAYNSSTGKARGLCLEIIESMREQLGFEYNIVLASDPHEAVDMLKNGTADVTLNFVTPTAARLEFTDRTVDMVQDGIQMISKKVIFTIDFFHVFLPFSFYVWMSIVVAIVLLSVTLYVCDKISPNTQGKLTFTPFESFFLVLSSFLMSKVETEPRKLSSRLFTLLLWFSTLLYMTTYLSNLVAFLIKPDAQTVFSSIGDLLDTRGYKWGFIKDSLIETELKVGWPRVYSRAEREWPEEMHFSTLEQTIVRVLKDPYFVVIDSADTLSYLKNGHCNLRVMGNIANSHYLTWLFRKGFRFKNDLDNQLRTHKQSKFAVMRSKYFDLNRCYTGHTGPENLVSLGFNYFYGIFVLLGVGIAFGFVQLLGRWIFSRLRERWYSQGKVFRFKLGHKYQAEVYDARSNGVYVRISGDSEVRFIDNSCLYPNIDEPSRKSNSKLKGKRIYVQYLGKCSVSGAKIFVRPLGIGSSLDSDSMGETNA